MSKKKLEHLFEEIVMPKQEMPKQPFVAPKDVTKPTEINSKGKEGKDDHEPKEVKFVIQESKDYAVIFNQIWNKKAGKLSNLTEARQKAMRQGARLFWESIFDFKNK